MVNCNKCKNYILGVCSIDNAELEETEWDACDFYTVSKTCQSCSKNVPCVKILRNVQIQFNDCPDYMAYREMNVGDDCPKWADIEADAEAEEEVPEEDIPDAPADVPEAPAEQQSEDVQFSNIL